MVITVVPPLLLSGTLYCGCRCWLLIHQSPDEAGKFSGDGGTSYFRFFAFHNQCPVAFMEPLHTGERDGGGCSVNVGQGCFDPAPDDGFFNIMQYRFNELGATAFVTGFRDRTAVLFIAGGVFSGNQPQKRHQGAGRSKPAEVGNFSDQDHSGKRADTLKGA